MNWRQRLGWFLFLSPLILSYVILLIVFCGFFGIGGIIVGAISSAIVFGGLAMVTA